MYGDKTYTAVLASLQEFDVLDERTTRPVEAARVVLDLERCGIIKHLHPEGWRGALFDTFILHEVSFCGQAYGIAAMDPRSATSAGQLNRQYVSSPTISIDVQRRELRVLSRGELSHQPTSRHLFGVEELLRCGLTGYMSITDQIFFPTNFVEPSTDVQRENRALFMHAARLASVEVAHEPIRDELKAYFRPRHKDPRAYKEGLQVLLDTIPRWGQADARAFLQGSTVEQVERSRCERQTVAMREAERVAKLVDEANGQQANIEPKKSVVYAISPGDKSVVKIGVAANASTRLKALQCGSPIKLHIHATVPGSYPTERELHKKFQNLRRSGEWFDNTDGTVLSWFENVIKEGPAPRRHHISLAPPLSGIGP